MNVDISDDAVLELAAHILEINISEDGEDAVIEAFNEEYDMSVWDFQLVLEKLIPLITIDESPIDGRKFKGFAANGTWLVKQEI